jgi:hypothetical protein
MRKYLPFALAVLVILAGTTFIAGAATPPEKVSIDDCVAKKAAVEFPHGAHVKAIAECKTCHHTQPALTATSGEKVETCGSCHTAPEKAETQVQRDVGDQESFPQVLRQVPQGRAGQEGRHQGADQVRPVSPEGLN